MKNSLKIFLLFFVSLTSASAAENHVGLKPIKVYLDWFPNVEFAGIFLAKERGWYEEEGIALEVIHQDLNVVDHIVQRDADIGMDSAPRIITKVQEGAPIKSFATQYQLNPNSILAADRPNIKSVRDLKGKKIGIFAPQDVDMFRVMLGFHGISIDQVTKVPMRSFKEIDIIEALKTGYVDAIIGWEFNWSVSFALLGYKAKLFPGYDSGYNFYGTTFFARNDFIEKNQDLLVRFIRVTMRGWRAVYEDTSSAAEFVVNRYFPADRYLVQSKELTQKQQKLELKLRLRYFREGVGDSYWGYMTDEKWRIGIDIAKNYKLIPKDSSLKPRDVFDDRILGVLFAEKKIKK